MQIINVMGASIDGRIASHPNESDAERKRYGFTNEADHAHLRRLLATCDAVIVGGHSVNVSGGVMEVQREDGVYPTWVLCSNSGFAAINPFGRSPIRPSGWCRARRWQRIVVQVVYVMWCTEAKAWRRPLLRRAKRRGSNACCSLGVASSTENSMQRVLWTS